MKWNMTETTVLFHGFHNSSRKISVHPWLPVFLLADRTPQCWWSLVFFYSVVNKKYELVLLRNGPCFQFDSLHWRLQENNDIFWGSKRTNWFEGFLTLSQPTIICQNPWHTQQRKNNRFEQKSTCGRKHGGKFAYTKDPELVFHSSWHLHWHYSTQLWSPCLLHIIFVTFCQCLWWFMAIFQSWVCGFYCHLFLLGLHRGSRIWCWCLFSCVLFLLFFKKGNSKIWDCFSHDYHGIV